MTESERYEALLVERAAALASRGFAAARTAALSDYLVCALGAERFGFPMSTVAAVIPERACTTLPGAPPALRGVIAEAGIIVTIIDLARALDLAPAEVPNEPGHFLRLRIDGPPVALAVDRVNGLAAVAPGSVEAPPAADLAGPFGSGAISGYAVQDREHVGSSSEGFAIVDPVRLLRPFLS